MAVKKNKELFVTLKLSSEVLGELSGADFNKANEDQGETPKLKVKLNPNVKRQPLPSPTPELSTVEGTPSSIPQSASKTSLSKVLNADDLKLDKSGKPVRKWVKKPLEIQSFTGYFMNYDTWTGLRRADDDTVEEHKPLKIQIKLNNKNLDLKSVDSRDQSPMPDDASSVVSTPEGSRLSTPAL
ncbi:unnamed protein product [Cyberlindnera jadinii]|uniref:Uncharacterized protein n=1 Tax=Cyberlindnera jadinii (strain ATCC 18201 / CBS 1600 / BCRC 20928 / JCM 3617 / NBRC 0987 / NRRL Y-1542) TaxID=983966 RepID=A0A0H5C2V1_CYBJN|nr:hypothetical protein CYBJADRAFT_102426 [Cyberlindnera jadinii NRRL Y-1542]ODV72842.1 hypothetical protein CYBJADRAFT_102426 [Cyberlindnera jadinii NRRL Y-1542]CEP22136.1 unnamed protein product [Cyberlindnera jadinii]